MSLLAHAGAAATILVVGAALVAVVRHFAVPKPPVAASQAPPLDEQRPRTEAERARVADLFLEVIGVVVAHNRGKFAHECWQCQYICRETRYVAGVTQPGSLADMVFHGCRLGGVSKLLEEARKCKREECEWHKGTAQLMRAAWDNDVERVQQLFRLGCPTAVVNAQDYRGDTALRWASDRGYEAVVRELLAHGTDVNIKSKNGSTAVISASYYRHVAVVRVLCDVPGIDLAARCAGISALGWALHYYYAEVAAFLRSRCVPE